MSFDWHSKVVTHNIPVHTVIEILYASEYVYLPK